MPIFFDILPGSLPLQPDCIGNRWDQENVSRPMGHPQYHWLQGENGCGVVTVGDIQLQLRGGQGILIAPFVPHAYRRQTASWHTSFFTLAGHLAPFIDSIVGPGDFLLADADRANFIQIWIDRTIDQYRAGSIDAMQISADCYALLLELNDECAVHDHNDPTPYSQYVKPALLAIEQRFAEPLTVRNLSAELYVSPQYLSRLFQRHLGCSTYAYIANYKISKAKELLINRRELKVQHIAHLVGFQDASHFVSAFRNSVGYTPLGFRRLYGL